MRWKLSSFQILVLATAALAILTFCAAAIHHSFQVPDPVAIRVTGQPTLGSADAKVEVVVFEDFMCDTCRYFSEEIFPKLHNRYVASGQIRYTFVPLAFIDGSKPLANAALAVYKIAPQKFWAYAHELFAFVEKHSFDGAEDKILLELADEVGGIDLFKLKNCIKTSCHAAELEMNFSAARDAMGKEFGTPALFVNGIKTSPVDYKAIETRIDKALYLAEK